jgi:uroporphyrinogen-III decarboxylase
MTSKELVLTSLNHKDPGVIPLDIGGCTVTGMHCLAVEKLRKHFGLSYKPVKVIEPIQMLGEVDEELKAIMGVDVEGMIAPKNKFGMYHDAEWKEFRTLWGQVVLLPADFRVITGNDGSHLVPPEGDLSAVPSAKMPAKGFYFDPIVRQQPIIEESLDVEDNLEEFSMISERDIEYWKKQFSVLKNSERAVIAGFGGTALGDVSLVPATNLKNPKGIRDITEWYLSVELRRDYLHQLFDRQTDIALHNLKRIYEAGGDVVDVVYICGTDFGTQDSLFYSTETFDELYAPYYRKLNHWIHQNTNWKTFKHSCGAVEPLISSFIQCGFDILNPVQISAAGMDPETLKKKYGDRIVFWGGGVDTQDVLAFGSPERVKKQVTENCRIFGKGGGFIFNTVHNIQATVPVENIAAMLDALEEFRR